MRRSIDDALDDHPADDDERPPVSWAVALSDDCDACGEGELRVVLTVEEAGQAGLGLVAHLSPDTTRRMPRRDRRGTEGDRGATRPLIPGRLRCAVPARAHCSAATPLSGVDPR